MKTKITVTVSILLCAYICTHAQQGPTYDTFTHVYTCNGTQIIARIASYELTADQKVLARSELLNKYGYLGITSADIVDDASYMYNCQSEPVLVGIKSLFCETTEAQAEKIFYYAGDHSAVKSSVSGKYESKWGQYPVVRHSPTQAPSGYVGSSRKYYKKPSLSVPTIYSITGPTYHPNGQYADYRVVLANGSPTPTNYQWILNPQNGNSVYGANSSMFTVAFYNAGSYQIACRAASANGWGEYATLSVQVYNPASSSSASTYSIPYPNPATDMLTVSFNSELVAQSKLSLQSTNSISRTTTRAFSLSVKLYNNQGVLQCQATSTGENIEIDISRLPNGIYLLHVHDGITENPEVHKIIVKH